ncbi:hypothetical protein BDV23DRAFT_147765 [Aspergillus alliaceus]|uniref:Uncharacterized protein n=1 Tax=Petromyces alliaceus TaxID=209559 RepID=A0A5N7CKF2_PETAA|nr:hypothetical protein BDV23DRAFT_147765 [Aspergillus alliaceus]
MGNICSRSRNEPEAFTTPGRVLGSANPPPGETGESSSGPRAPLPAKASTGRPLGGAGAPGAGPDTADARANAAIAAQVSYFFPFGSVRCVGLRADVRCVEKGRVQTLNKASISERVARDVDNAASG